LAPYANQLTQVIPTSAKGPHVTCQYFADYAVGRMTSYIPLRNSQHSNPSHQPLIYACRGVFARLSSTGQVISRSWRYPHEGVPARLRAWAVAPCVAIVTATNRCEFDGVLSNQLPQGIYIRHIAFDNASTCRLRCNPRLFPKTSLHQEKKITLETFTDLAPRGPPPRRTSR